MEGTETTSQSIGIHALRFKTETKMIEVKLNLSIVAIVVIMVLAIVKAYKLQKGDRYGFYTMYAIAIVVVAILICGVIGGIFLW